MSASVLKVRDQIFREGLTNKRLTRDIASSIGKEVHSRVGDITHVPKSAQGLRLDVGRFSVGREEALQTLSECKIIV